MNCGNLQDDDLLDRDVQTFAEECDSLQGFQILLESDSAWGGFATEYLEIIREEYPKASIWTWGIESGLVCYFSMDTSYIQGDTDAKVFVRSDNCKLLRKYVALYTTRSAFRYSIKHLN